MTHKPYTAATHKSLHHKSLRNFKSLRFFGDFDHFPKKTPIADLKKIKSLRFFGIFFVTIYGSRLYLINPGLFEVINHGLSRFLLVFSAFFGDFCLPLFFRFFSSTHKFCLKYDEQFEIL